jgi:type IV secretory pathway TraG/TraD family ATPase VirD4
MSTARTNSGDLGAALPEGSLLVAALAAGAGAVALVPLLAGALLLALTLLVGARLRTLLLIACVAAVGLIALDARSAGAAYWHAAPVWRIPDQLAARGLAAWLAAIAPVALAGAAVGALGGRLWLDLRAPFWAQRRQRSSVPERVRNRRARRALVAGRAGSEGVPLGIDERGRVVTVSEQELSQHALVLGATGSGKTTTVLQLLGGLIPRGLGLVMIDLKGDPELVATLRALTTAHGRVFELWTLEGPAHWNPLARGDATELMDKLIGLEQWTEPHYKRAAQRYLHIALRTLERAERDPDLVQLSELLDPEALLSFAHSPLASLPEEERERLERYCEALDRSSKSAIQSLANRLALLAETRPGDYLQSSADSIDLQRTLAEGRVSVFSLDAQKYGETAAHVAALVAQDLKTVASTRLAQRGRGQLPRAGYVALDEFSAMRSDQVLGLLARGRSAGLSVVLSTQELADLSRVDPAFAEQVLGNTNLKLIHRQDVPESAERLAGVAGTRSSFEETLQTERSPFVSLGGKPLGGHRGRNTGLGSIRQVEHYVVHPNVLKQLEQGSAVLIRKHPRASVTRVRVVATTPSSAAPQRTRAGTRERKPQPARQPQC